VTLGLITVYVQRYVPSNSPVELGGFVPRLTRAGVVVFFYLGKFIVPVALMPMPMAALVHGPVSQHRVLPLTSAQIRAARSLIRWTAEDLASASALSVATIRRAELKESVTALTAANDLAIRRALKGAGVEFIEENGGGPGVRLRKPQRQKS
jgi:hypothetical protein